MAFDRGTLDTALSAAAGEDPALIRELRAAFIESAERQLDLLGRSRCDANWRFAAERLHGLAASFEVTDLIALADEAGQSAPGDPYIQRKIREALTLLAV